MWRLRIDIDSDGQLETVLRLDDGRRVIAIGGPGNCVYRDASMYLLEGNEELMRHFNRRGAIGDLIHDGETDRYLLIEWSTNPATGQGIWRRGLPVRAKNATGGVAVYEVMKESGPIAACNIQW